MKNNLGFVGQTYKWFIGQVPPGQNQYVKNPIWNDAHGERVKVRIPGKHPKSGELADDDLPWAIVAQPTSQGNRNGGSTGLWGGEWVVGFFMDESEQIPVITHVLGVNDTHSEIIKSENGSTQFKKVKRYNFGMTAEAHQLMGGPKPTASALPTSGEFKSANKTFAGSWFSSDEESFATP
jgi:hypothetical protein